MADPRSQILSLQQEIACLHANRRVLAARVRKLEEWVETVSSPVYKRLWWVLCGYRWRRLGRWYPPEWRG